jgi:hypothetical protein
MPPEDFPFDLVSFVGRMVDVGGAPFALGAADELDELAPPNGYALETKREGPAVELEDEPASLAFASRPLFSSPNLQNLPPNRPELVPEPDWTTLLPVKSS